MPELPEVETMVRDLLQRVVGRTVTGVDAPFAGSVRYPDVPEFVERVTGRTITDVRRRGKYAVFDLDSGDVLIVHRGMSGSLLLRAETDPMEAHVRLILSLDDGTELRFDDPRKFGKVFLMDGAGSERSMPWVRMGPEPLSPEFTPQYLASSLRRRKAPVKPLLLNQNIVAGLGNIYVDESLFAAGIHPLRPAGSLSEQEIARLHAAVREILSAAVEGRGTTFSNYRDIEGRQGSYQRALSVFRRAGEQCPACGTRIERIVVGGRGTHVCPACQA